MTVGAMTRVEAPVTSDTDTSLATPQQSPNRVKRAVRVEQLSSETADTDSGTETPRLIRKMTPVVTHNTSSSEDSDGSVGNVKQMARIEEEMEDCDPRDLDLSQLIMTDHGHQKPKTKAMRGSSQLMVPRPADSRMERISETSEGAASRSSSEDDPRRGGRAEVRRSSSGITSSSFIHKLSPDYQSVYSKEEDEKRRSRDKDIYKSSSRV